MLSDDKRINRFYRSAAWQQARLIKITSANGICEKCGAIGEEVHHVIHINSTNIEDINVTLNQDNLLLLCKDCHNKEHGRFKAIRQKFDAEGNLIN